MDYREPSKEKGYQWKESDGSFTHCINTALILGEEIITPYKLDNCVWITGVKPGKNHSHLY